MRLLNKKTIGSLVQQITAVALVLCLAIALSACGSETPKGIAVDKSSDVIRMLIDNYKNGEEYSSLASVSKGKLKKNLEIIAKGDYKYIVTTNPLNIYTSINGKEPALAENQEIYGIVSSFGKAGDFQLKLGEYFKGYAIISHNKDTGTYYISEFTIRDEKK